MGTKGVIDERESGTVGDLMDMSTISRSFVTFEKMHAKYAIEVKV